MPDQRGLVLGRLRKLEEHPAAFREGQYHPLHHGWFSERAFDVLAWCAINLLMVALWLMYHLERRRLWQSAG